MFHERLLLGPLRRQRKRHRLPQGLLLETEYPREDVQIITLDGVGNRPCKGIDNAAVAPDCGLYELGAHPDAVLGGMFRGLFGDMVDKVVKHRNLLL
jgi:hypothetical protein